jgi:hypothetical protein
MLVYFGTKTTWKKLGRVADYCLICHCRRPFQVFRVSESFHVCEIALSETRLVGFERVCDVCGQRYPADVKAYAAMSRRRNCDLDTLIRRTNPELAAGIASEIALNERLQNKSLARDDRLALIAGPFYAVFPPIRERALATHIDWWSGMCVVATFVLPLLIIATLGIGDPSRQPALITAGVLTVASLALLATDVARYIRRTARPRLIRALAPFDPTLEELQTLALTDAIVGKVAKRVDLTKLHRDLRTESVMGSSDSSRS